MFQVGPSRGGIVGNNIDDSVIATLLVCRVGHPGTKLRIETEITGNMAHWFNIFWN
jgi:hypothetical protein